MLPITNAAGTVKLVEQARNLARAPVAEVVIGSYTVEPRDGNGGRVYHSEAAVALNALGMPNPGIGYVIEHAQEFSDLGKPVVVSIAGFSHDEFRHLAECCRWGPVAVEVNFGCPNAWENGHQHGIASFDTPYIRDVLRSVRFALAGCGVEVRAKLSPYSDPEMLAEAVRHIRADHPIVACNTFPNGWLPGVLDVPYGGVSGAAMKAIVLGQIRQYRALGVDRVIAAGGVRTGEDVADYEAAGAVAVQVGSRYLDGGEDPGVFGDLISAALGDAAQNQERNRSARDA